MTDSIRFEVFTEQHYSTYKTWFRYKSIKETLYDADQEWLEAVLTQEDGINYAIMHKDKLVGQIGITFPKSEYNYYVITSIAVNPILQKIGLGKGIINETQKLYPLSEGEYWAAYVENKNVAAQKFFESLYWNKGIEEDEMIQYYYLKN